MSLLLRMFGHVSVYYLLPRWDQPQDLWSLDLNPLVLHKRERAKSRREREIYTEKRGVVGNTKGKRVVSGGLPQTRREKTKQKKSPNSSHYNFGLDCPYVCLDPSRHHATPVAGDMSKPTSARATYSQRVGVRRPLQPTRLVTRTVCVSLPLIYQTYLFV